MKVESLHAEGFRNISESNISFCDGVNLLFGQNGAGKTNALEAIYLFAICKSFRTSREQDFIMHKKDDCSLSLCYSSDFDKSVNDSHRMSLRFHKEKKKEMKYEGVGISRISEFIGNFRAVFFTPDHLSLIKGSPDERRKFADMALSQIKPGYIRYLSEYQRVLSQRNICLKNARKEGRIDRDLLYVYSEKLSELAAVITKQRYLFSVYIEKEASAFYEEISGNTEKLFIKYCGCTKERFDDTEYTKEKYLSLYTSNIDGEIKNGVTKYGPHKDDILFYIGKNRSSELSEIYENEINSEESEKKETLSTFAARTFASQGQQRTAVLSLKLAEGEIIKNLTGEYPVYLFDDVLSELDRERKKQLLSLFCDKQVIITCCDENAFEDSLVAKKIKVKNGVYTSVQ